jgi:hypothetical protein
MTYARPIPSGYEYREGGEMLPDDIPLTRAEFEALCEERAEFLFGKVVCRA